MLVRCFPKMHSPHSLVEYERANMGHVPPNEIQVHTWPDASLRELTDLLKHASTANHKVREIVTAARRRSAQLTFSIVFPDRRGRYVMRPAGRVHSLKGKEDDSEVTLGSLRFQPGDFLDVCVVDAAANGAQGPQQGYQQQHPQYPQHHGYPQRRGGRPPPQHMQHHYGPQRA